MKRIVAVLADMAKAGKKLRRGIDTVENVKVHKQSAFRKKILLVPGERYFRKNTQVTQCHPMRKAVFVVISIVASASLIVLTVVLTTLLRDSDAVSREAISSAQEELMRYVSSHPGETARTLAVVDYSRPSYMKRMVIIDLRSGKQSAYRVAHGKKSGELYASLFSNVPDSNMSSLGLFRVGKRYCGEHGLALRLEGVDSLQNSNAAARDIVLHSAGYVSVRYIMLNLLTAHGPMIGRSNGCFAVSRTDIEEVADKLADGGFIYAWASYNSSKQKNETKSDR